MHTTLAEKKVNKSTVSNSATVAGNHGDSARVIGIKWDEMYSKRTHRMRRSAIRELLKVTRRPEVISFAGGLPAAELFPIPQVKEAVNSVLDRLGGKSLQYGETEGVPELREWI